jgi:hypothetical protein
MIKKIPSNQVIVTPNATSSVKLDELNRIVREMETGDDARKRLQQLDNSKGMVAPDVKRSAEAEFKRGQQAPMSKSLAANTDSALDDKTLAINMLSQAKKMEVEAKGMIAEAARMKKDAQRMHPSVRVDAYEQSVAVQTEITPAVPAPRRGRKPKVVASDAVQ